jgi:hypothetical protein
VFLPYGPSYRSREAAADALEDYYASGEFSSEERCRIAKRGSRYVILVEDY